MQRYFLYLSYNGTPYCGWQIQPDQPTVQGALEEALSKLFKHPVGVVGCGRTDTGVHASAYFAQFDIETPIPLQERATWRYQLNALLDKSIAVHAIFEVPDDFHVRYSALRRTYHYYIHTRKDPFLDDRSFYCKTPFDVESIRKAAAKLTGYSDFTSFAKLHAGTTHNICQLTRAEFRYLGEDRWVFVFTANRFLRNMVRSMVGTLLEIGFGKHTVDDLDRIVAAKDRCAAGNSMPPQALFLAAVEYF